MIYKINSNLEAVKVFKEAAADRAVGNYVLFSDSNWVLSGHSQETYSSEKQQEKKMNGFPLSYKGGACVVFEGDLSLLKLEHASSSTFGNRMIRIVREYLVSKGIQAKIDKNDLMVFFPREGKWKKCGSWAQGHMKQMDYLQTAVHFSINVDVELIQEICTKPMVKVPGALSSFGITAQELYEVVEPFLE